MPENANSHYTYISGGNLDGLKHLLKSYSKRIKYIYIDPPYIIGAVPGRSLHRLYGLADNERLVRTGGSKKSNCLELPNANAISFFATASLVWPRLKN